MTASCGMDRPGKWGLRFWLARRGRFRALPGQAPPVMEAPFAVKNLSPKPQKVDSCQLVANRNHLASKYCKD
jgi:hypothetical protein